MNIFIASFSEKWIDGKRFWEDDLKMNSSVFWQKWWKLDFHISTFMDKNESIQSRSVGSMAFIGYFNP